MSIFRQMEQRHLVASCPRLKMAVMITSSASGSRVYSWTLLAILALANQMSLAAEADIETSPTTDTFPNCRTQERTEFMRCRMRFEATGLSNRAEMRKNYCSIITNIIQTCFTNFDNCASPVEIQTAKDRFLIKEYLSASLYGDLFPTLLACSPTLELLGSSRYGMNTTSGRHNCNGIASLRTQMDCTKMIIPKMVAKQRLVPIKRNSQSGYATADPKKLKEFRNLLCEAAANITSGRCESDKIDNTVASALDPSTRHCWSHDKVNVAVPSDDTDMVDFYGQTLIYNLNRLITQRASLRGVDDNPVEAITPSCLKMPIDVTTETIIPQTYENTHPKNPKSQIAAAQCQQPCNNAMTTIPITFLAVASPLILAIFK